MFFFCSVIENEWSIPNAFYSPPPKIRLTVDSLKPFSWESNKQLMGEWGGEKESRNTKVLSEVFFPSQPDRQLPEEFWPAFSPSYRCPAPSGKRAEGDLIIRGVEEINTQSTNKQTFWDS